MKMVVRSVVVDGKEVRKKRTEKTFYFFFSSLLLLVEKECERKGFRANKERESGFYRGTFVAIKIPSAHFGQKIGAPPLLAKEALPLSSRCKILSHFIFRVLSLFL